MVPLINVAELEGQLLVLAERAGMQGPELSCSLTWMEAGQRRPQTLVSNILGIGLHIVARIRENAARMAQEFWEEREAALHMCTMRWYRHDCPYCGESYLSRSETPHWCGYCWEEE